MDILGRARRLESKLARGFDRTAQQWTQPGPRAPLELLHAIVEAVDEALEPAGRGAHLFPFNRMRVSIVAPTAEARARFDALLASPPSLSARIQDRLQRAGISDAAPQITVTYVDDAGPGWSRPDLHVVFERVGPGDLETTTLPGPDTLWISVVHGTAEQSSYVFSVRRVNLGRYREVRDDRNQLVRTNDVIFIEDDGGPNSSVSRRHAHIEYAGDPREFRLCDDGSVRGTSILRDGRAIAVPRGARGMRLRSDDEVLLGEARLRVRIS